MAIELKFVKGDDEYVEYYLKSKCDIGLEVDFEDSFESIELYTKDGTYIGFDLKSFLKRIVYDGTCSNEQFYEINSAINDLQEYGEYSKMKVGDGVLTLKMVENPTIDVDYTSKQNDWTIYELNRIQINGKPILNEGIKCGSYYHFFNVFSPITNAFSNRLKKSYPNLVDIDFDVEHNNCLANTIFLETKDIKTMDDIVEELGIIDKVDYRIIYNNKDEVVKVKSTIRILNCVSN